MKSYRRERVASVIRDIVSEAIAHQLNDPRVEPLTTVTRVEMVGDLDIACIYLSVSGDAATERRTLSAIQHASGFIQRIVAKEMIIRQVPMIRFEIDLAAKVAQETMKLMSENRRNNPEAFEGKVEADGSLVKVEDEVEPSGCGVVTEPLETPDSSPQQASQGTEE